jgi:hypothetical protein
MAYNRRSTIGAFVTLTSANTNYNLAELVQAVLDAETGTASGGVVPSMVRQVVIQSYPGLAGAGANTAEILIGDGKLSTARFGIVLTVGANFSDRSNTNNVAWGDFYARSAAANQKLSILITTG